MRKPRLPLSCEDFLDIRENGYYYVDKTRFICKVLSYPARPTLITRPRRFGKTLALSTLYHFFSPEEADGNRKSFENTWVSTSPEAQGLSEKFRGKIPVLFFSLKECASPTYEGFKRNLSLDMSDLSSRFPFIEETASRNPAWKRQYESIMACDTEDEVLSRSLANIMNLVAQYYKRKVAVLIDEYDNPLNAFSSSSSNERDRCIAFMRQFMGKALKTNSNLAFAVITGVHRIAKENIFSGINNLYVSSVQNPGIYADDIGFTEDEVSAMAEAFGLPDEKMGLLKEWYDGYRFGDVEAYNPWSVMHFIESGGDARPYWENTSANGIVREYLSGLSPKSIETVGLLYEGKPVESRLEDALVYDSAGSREAVLSLMVSTGYLKPVCRMEDSDTYLLAIPNREIRGIFHKEILDWCIPRDSEAMRDFSRSLSSGDANGLGKCLHDMVSGMASFHDTARETFYHGFLLGLLAASMDRYIVESNREAGDGRFDIGMFPKHGTLPGIVMELKAARDGGKLQDAAREGMAQISRMGYAKEMGKRGVRHVLLYAIAFHKSEVAIEARRILPDKDGPGDAR